MQSKEVIHYFDGLAALNLYLKHAKSFPMITEFKVENFKSLKRASIKLGRITVLTGANNSGKSSFLYSLLALKNTVSNPNQSLDACLTLPFINLGGFKETVYLKDEELQMSFEITFKEGESSVSYQLRIGKISSSIGINGLNPIKFNSVIDISLPYPGNKTISETINIFEGLKASVEWNGFIAKNVVLNSKRLEENPTDINEQNQVNKYSDQLIKLFYLPLSHFAKIDYVPMRRGFTQPYYNPVPLSSQVTNEEEIASLLGNDRDLAGKVAFYLEKIVERSFSVYSPPGLATIFLQTMDKKNGFTSDLVNEGLGTNQLVTILAKILQKQNKFICIDEPEIHLHPTIIDRLVTVLVEMAEHEDKQFLVSTHSEHFMNSLLKHVSSKQIRPEDVSIYHLNKERKETSVEQQKVNEDGQISGGLKNFYQSELENMKSFFKLTD